MSFFFLDDVDLQCSNGKKEPERSSPNAEGVRRSAVGAEDRAPKARGVSMQLAGLQGKRCKLPQRVRAEPGRQTTFGAFGLKMLNLFKRQLKTFLFCTGCIRYFSVSETTV